MKERDASIYRQIAARVNYLALDRPDLVFAAKEASRVMSSPEVQDWERLQQIAGYLRNEPRLVFKYLWQEEGRIEAGSDSDWAGCEETKKSAPGGFVMRGKHLLRAWSKTQPTVALSTGEAELIACVRATSESLGIQSTAKDFGREERIELKIDASAAIAMVHRRGLGKMRHLSTGWLWVQEKAHGGQIRYTKVPRREHIADVFTKAAAAEGWRKAEAGPMVQTRQGRPEAAPRL